MALRVPDSEGALHDWARSVVEDARDLRRGHETAWWEQLCIYSGDLWVEYNPHSKRLEELPQPDHRVRLPINLVSPIVRTEYAKLLKNKPIVECIARSGDKSDIDAAKMGDKILNNYAEKQFNLPSIRREALMWTLTCGLGAIFVDYDETEMGEIDVLADPAGNPIFDPAQIKSIQSYYRDKHRSPNTISIPQGDLRIRALGPMQWGWDFSVNNPNLAAWCYVSEVYDATVVKRRWGVDVEVTDEVRPNLLEQRVLEKVDLTGHIKGSNVKPESQDLVIIHRLFVKPGHRYFPDGAEIIFTEQEMLDATKYPHGHNKLPVLSMGHIPFPGSKYPLSVISQIRDPALEISKTESQMLENRNLMGNPPWIEYHEHGIPDDKLVNKPGMRLKVQYRPNMPDPHPIEMPEMPAYIQNLPELLRQHVQEIAGQGETSQGRVPPGARSGVAIAYLQEEDDTKLGPTVSEYEEMMEGVAWQVLRLIAERYDVPRTARIPKPHALPEVFDFVGSMLSGIAAVQVQAGSALPRSKAAKQQFWFDVASMGIETDPRKLKEALELGDSEPNDIDAAEQQADRENELMERGQQAPVKDWYNHEVHIGRHRRFMMSADYEAMPPNLQQIFDDHDALHQKFITGIAQAAQAGIPTPGQTMNGQPPPEGGGPPAEGATTQTINAQPQ